MRERWADELGDPEGSLLSEEDRTILDDDTPERAEADRRTVEAWEGAHSAPDIKGAAEEARAKLLNMR